MIVFLLSIFEIDTESYEKSRAPQGRRIATPTVYVNIYYDEHLADGTVKHHRFDKIKLLTAKQDPSGVSYSYGLDGNNTSPLLAKIEAIMANPENKGKRVILTAGSRTNGIVKYDGNGNTVITVKNVPQHMCQHLITTYHLIHLQVILIKFTVQRILMVFVF